MNYAPLLLYGLVLIFYFLNIKKLIHAEYDNCETNTVQTEQMPTAMF